MDFEAQDQVNKVLPSTSTNMFDTLPVLCAPPSSELHDELERYLSTDPEHVTDACAWWHEQRLLYPHLYRMALDYLTIPATLVDVEQVFSQGWLVLSHIRSCLSVQSTCALMCLSVWSRLRYVKDSNIKAVVILPGVPADKKEEELVVG